MTLRHVVVHEPGLVDMKLTEPSCHKRDILPLYRLPRRAQVDMSFIPIHLLYHPYSLEPKCGEELAETRPHAEIVMIRRHKAYEMLSAIVSNKILQRFIALQLT